LRIEALPELPAEWQELADERGTFYHQPAWLQGIARCFGYPLHAVVAREGSALVGGLPLAVVPGLLRGRRLVSFPFSYAVGPIERREGVRSELGRGAIELAARLGATRAEVKQLGAEGTTPPGFERRIRYSTFRLDTSGGERAIWKRLNASSTQRGIKKAEREGVEVVEGTTASDWLMMAVLEEQTAHRLGTPPPPRRFFVEFGFGLQARGLASLYMARLPDATVGGAIVVWKGRREWIYGFGASRPEALELRPNHALLWRAVRDAAAAGVVFDLGRAAPEQEGLVQFKRRWGGEEVPLAYDYWPNAGGLNVSRRDKGPLALAAAAWSRLPAPVARLGAYVYRYLG